MSQADTGLSTLVMEDGPTNLCPGLPEGCLRKITRPFDHAHTREVVA